MRVTIEKTYNQLCKSSFEIKNDKPSFNELLNSFITAARNFGYSEQEMVSLLTEEIYEKVRKGSK